MPETDPSRAYDEVVAFFANGPSREEINAFRLSAETTDRIRQLLLKKSADLFHFIDLSITILNRGHAGAIPLADSTFTGTSRF